MQDAGSKDLRGVIAATPTPLREDLTIDFDRLIDHCRWLLGPGRCDGINLLGTTGEATSLSVDARLAAMRAVASSGLPLDRMMVGTGAAALLDAVKLTAAARDLGYAGALLLPPFYYKDIDQESLAAYVGSVIAGAGSDGLKLYLYHFPQNSGIPYGIDTVAQLQERFPSTVVGLKDSAGNIEYTRELARRLTGLAVFPGSESVLSEAPRAGFAGCISATVNVTAGWVQSYWQAPDSDHGRSALALAGAVRQALSRHAFVATVKWALSDITHQPGWTRVLPPMRPLSESEGMALAAALAGTAYKDLSEPAAKWRAAVS
jgi:4-hydroxy-tetrahydrodipicolinate synthase